MMLLLVTRAFAEVLGEEEDAEEELGDLEDLPRPELLSSASDADRCCCCW